MDDIANQAALLREQYHDASNLLARMDLLARFGTRGHSTFRWRFNHLNLSPRARVLELGCGTGAFWQQNLDRIPSGWEGIISDFSPGMLQTAQRALDTSSFPFEFAVIDAQSIPYPDESFDAVLAYHMLYHVPDRHPALAEIRRVLRPGGSLYASTVGESHMRELIDAIYGPGTRTFGEQCGFDCEHGAEQLAQAFSNVECYPEKGELRITEVQPLVAYALSSGSDSPLTDDRKLVQFVSWAERTIREQGFVHVTTSNCLFEAHVVPCSRVTTRA